MLEDKDFHKIKRTPSEYQSY